MSWKLSLQSLPIVPRLQILLTVDIPKPLKKMLTLTNSRMAPADVTITLQHLLEEYTQSVSF